MNDSNVPPLRRPAGEAELDAALQAATTGTARRPAEEAPLKKQWDDDLERELEDALAGFDPSTYEVGSTGRDRPSQRGLAPKGQRGQEERQGPQTGKVIAIRGKSVFIDLGAKSEGVVPLDQFPGEPPKVGDLIAVVPDRFDPEEGLLLLSLKGAAVQASWENLRKGLVVEARVLKTNKGGLEVDVDGIRGFMPIGQIDINRVDDAATFINQKLRAVVTEANQREKNLVVSRRELLEIERAELREKTWAELEEGQVRKGVIRSVRDFGAFVDVGGVDGLLHVGDMSWVRLKDAGNVVKPGQEVEVKILRIDRTTQKVSLGLKQLTPDPWDLVSQTYTRGSTIKGKITRLMEFGAFVELEPGIEGLIHISELGTSRVRRASDVVKPEQEVEVRVLKVEPEAKRISLSLRQVAPTESVADDEAPDEDEPPAMPKPPRKVPLKGGLGDRN